MWRWDQQEPFGDSPANENPSGAGAFDLPLRLPGQYYDAESGLHQNNFRDYDPSIGRYPESDPIGLRGGINTYTYAQSDVLWYIDPSGLSGYSGSPAIPPAGAYGPTNTISITFGGGFQYYFWGASAESGFAIESRGRNACFFTRTCSNKAFGAEIDLGSSLSASPGKVCSGTRTETSHFVSGGVVLGGGLEFSSDGGMASGYYGVAVGAAAGKNKCTVVYHCLIN
jgi:RHS repeat-associated protein